VGEQHLGQAEGRTALGEGLWKFITDAFEFVGGGVVFTASLAYLVMSFRTPQWLTESPTHLEALPSALVALAAVTVAYVVGVVAESASRGALEWDLNRLTVRHPRFDRPSKGQKTERSDTHSPTVGGDRLEGQPEDQPEDQPVEDQAGEGGASSPTGRLARSYNECVRYRYLGKDRCGVQFSGARLSAAVEVRERRRLRVAHPLHQSAIDSQLKRMRLERMIFLSAFVAAVGACIRWVDNESWWPVVVAAGTTFVLFRLVHVRFRRYLDAIARSR
jgi:hypothetical protein